MKRVFLWGVTAIVTFALIASLCIAFVASLGIGFVGAIQACGITLVTDGGGGESTPKPQPTNVPLVDPTLPELGIVGEGYLKQFSIAEQNEKKKLAALIVSIGANRPEKLSTHDIEAAIGVAIQESHITNLLVATDHDSLGIYQQRPSVGSWGTAEQIIDPVHAINKFYDALVRIPTEERLEMPLMEIGIKVQRPSRAAYERNWKWDDVAKALVRTYLPAANDNAGNICMESVGVSSGEWQSPLVAKSYCITAEYGMRLHPRSGKWKQHNGVDLACNNGDPIYAVHDGTVVMAGWYGDYGNYVEIEHGDRVTTAYGHMVNYAPGLERGDKVVAGQVIGYVGTTGGSTGAHLHFELKVEGKFRDPVPYMKDRGVTIE